MKATMRPEYMKGIVSCVAKNGTVTCGISPRYCSANEIAYLNAIDQDGCTYFLTYPTSHVKVLGVVPLPHYESSVIRAEQAATERRHRLATKRRVERERQEAHRIHVGSEMSYNPFAVLAKVA